MRILILGGTGFIGSYITELLIDAGHDVALFHRGVTRLKFSIPEKIISLEGRFEEIKGDWGDPWRRQFLFDYRSRFAEFKPDVVIDTYLCGEADADMVVNTFSGMVRRVVSLSSQDVYRAYGLVMGSEAGEAVATPLDENSRLRSAYYPYRSMVNIEESFEYHYDKILGEGVMQSSADFESVMVRLPVTYGPRDFLARFGPFLRPMLEDRPHIVMSEGFANWRWTHGYVENMAAGIVLAAVHPDATGSYNIGEAETPTYVERVKAMGRLLGWWGKIIVEPNDKLPEILRREGRFDQDLVSSSQKIRDELGYSELVSYEKGLYNTARWAKEKLDQLPDIDPKEYAAEDAFVTDIK